MSAILQAGCIEQRVRSIGNYDVTRDAIVLVHEPDQGVFRQIHGKVSPTNRNEEVLGWVPSQIYGIFRVILVTHHCPIRGAVEYTWLITQLPVNIVGRDKPEPLAGIARTLKISSHLVRPVLRMAYRQSCAVVREHAGVLVQINVGDI